MSHPDLRASPDPFESPPPSPDPFRDSYSSDALDAIEADEDLDEDTDDGPDDGPVRTPPWLRRAVPRVALKGRRADVAVETVPAGSSPRGPVHEPALPIPIPRPSSSSPGPARDPPPPPPRLVGVIGADDHGAASVCNHLVRRHGFQPYDNAGYKDVAATLLGLTPEALAPVAYHAHSADWNCTPAEIVGAARDALREGFQRRLPGLNMARDSLDDAVFVQWYRRHCADADAAGVPVNVLVTHCDSAETILLVHRLRGRVLFVNDPRRSLPDRSTVDELEYDVVLPNIGDPADLFALTDVAIAASDRHLTPAGGAQSARLQTVAPGSPRFDYRRPSLRDLDLVRNMGDDGPPPPPQGGTGRDSPYADLDRLAGALPRPRGSPVHPRVLAEAPLGAPSGYATPRGNN